MIQRCLLQRMPLELLKSKYDYLSKNSAPWLSIKLILEKQMFSNQFCLKTNCCFLFYPSLSQEMAQLNRPGIGHEESHSPQIWTSILQFGVGNMLLN